MSHPFRGFRITLLLLLALHRPLCSIPRSSLRGAVGTTSLTSSVRTLNYGKLPDQRGDLWMTPQAPQGLVVLFHGGFWLPQYGKELMNDVASDLVQRFNWAVWNVEYRRIAGPNWKDANSTLEDIVASLRFLESSEFPVKDVPISLVGHSAGGHLALWSQLRPVSTDIRCVVSVGGVLDLCYADEEALGGGAGAVARFLGYKDVTSLKQLVSPIDMLPPCLVNSLPPEKASHGTVPKARIGLVHGKRDEVVPNEQSIRFLVSSTCAGIPCELHMVLEEGHYEVLNPRSVSWNAVVDMVQQAFSEEAMPPKRQVLRTLREERGDEWIFQSRPV